MPEDKIKSFIITVTGLVQGVGFRPFVYREATNLNLTGRVENRADCVNIKIEGYHSKIDAFINALKNQAPELARIESINCESSFIENFKEFSIGINERPTKNSTLIPPDTAVCDKCLEDTKFQLHRKNYPFVTCTNCGPRFSIIKSMPYDRNKTTMDKFQMCSKCNDEYNTPADRRFHAQPNACCNCGPHYIMKTENKIIRGDENIIDELRNLISKGKIIAIKGIGGFQLICDARNNSTVKTLIKRKSRGCKPFAVMMPDINTVNKYVMLNRVEEQELRSNRKPILLLNKKIDIFQDVTGGLNSMGVLLPYTPIMNLVFENALFDSLVFTSGNVCSNPIVTSNDQAKKEFSHISDAILTYDRDIENHTDDSVCVVINNKNRVIRRSRGFVPEPITLTLDVDGICATGAELKNCFCIGRNNMAFLSQHMGDLKNWQTFKLYSEVFNKFKALFKVEPHSIAHDKHPDYISTKYARETGLDIVEVQHHHAHLISCMAENNFYGNTIGICFDGAGFGDDGHIWGGEFLIIKNVLNYKRYSHLGYIEMPGGDKAAEEPWRMAISYLYKTYGKEFTKLNLPFLNNLHPENIDLLVLSIEKSINSPLTSSMGRLFDTVAAITNICLVSTYEAEAPSKLETLIKKDVNCKYGYTINDTINVTELIKGVVKDVENNIDSCVIAAKFHNSIVSIILEVAQKIRKLENINSVVLSGGIFQNKYILEKSEEMLTCKGFNVYTHRKVPSNDGGIALGQLVIAAKKRSLICV